MSLLSSPSKTPDRTRSAGCRGFPFFPKAGFARNSWELAAQGASKGFDFTYKQQEPDAQARVSTSRTGTTIVLWAYFQQEGPTVACAPGSLESLTVCTLLAFSWTRRNPCLRRGLHAISQGARLGAFTEDAGTFSALSIRGLGERGLLQRSPKELERLFRAGCLRRRANDDRSLGC